MNNTFTYDQEKKQFKYNSENETNFYGDLKDKLDERKDKSWGATAHGGWGPFRKILNSKKVLYVTNKMGG